MRWSCCTCLGVVLFTLALMADEPRPVKSEDYPRRALVIQVHDYLYLDPIVTPPAVRNREAIERLATSLRIPNSRTNRQLTVLSDYLPAPLERLPTRGTIVSTIRRFCETCRAQDRMVVYFRGHAFERQGAAYFAPLEGDIEDLKSLIPVPMIYEVIKTCKATQKCVVWDVCPASPDHTPFRPAAGTMTLELLVALAAAPRDTEVLLACLPSEYSNGYSTPARGASGSFFFDALLKGLDESTAGQKPNLGAPIPFVESLPSIQKALETSTKGLGMPQSPKLFGKRPASLLPHDGSEPPAAEVTIPMAPQSVLPAVKEILQEVKLPGLVPGEADDPLPALPCDPDVLKPYESDRKIEDIFRDRDKFPLRAAVVHSLDTIREVMHAPGPRDMRPLTVLPSPVREATKKLALDSQGPLAVAITRLEGEMAALEAVEKERARENRRWQAHYDYTLAQVRLRLALLNEYNMALGHVRTESLPELVPGTTAWRLTHTTKMLSKKPIQELASSARTTLETMIATYRGTPWEILARRSLQTLPGIRWEPAVR